MNSQPSTFVGFGRSVVFRIFVICLLSYLPTSVQAALVSHWDFNSKTGCTISDQVGPHCGTLMGCSDITTSNCGFDGVGEALTLAGVTGEYMEASCCATSLCTDTSFTWSAWIKTSDTDGGIFVRAPNGTRWNQGSKALFVRCGTLQFDSGWVGNPQSGVTVNDCAWRHVAVAVEMEAGCGACNDLLKMYVCGALVHTTNNRNINRYDEDTHDGPWGDCTYAATGFSIGQGDITNPILCSCSMSDLCTLIGLIDDAAVWDEALTDDEMLVSYEVANCGTLRYDAGDFDVLKQVHDGCLTSVVLGAAGAANRKIWVRSTGLTGAAGVTSCSGDFTAVMNATACTGVTSATRVYWDRHDGSNGAAVGTTACGTWNDCNANWNVNSNGSGSNVAWACGIDVHFGACTDATGTYTVCVSGTKQVDAIYFEEGTVTLCGGIITMADNTPIIDVACGISATINSVLNGTNGITKTGGGTLTLSANNTNTGTVTISSGTVVLSASERIANAADVTLNGGTLQFAASVQETVADLSVAQNSGMVFNTQADITATNFSMTAGRTLAITGWNNSTRYSISQGDGTSFRVDNFPSGVLMSNITVNGVNANGIYQFVNGGDGFFYLSLMTPEPSTYLAGGAMLLLLGLHARRRILARARKAADESSASE